jgi:hypothetical protein
MDEKTHCDKIQSLLDDVKSGNADDNTYFALEDSCRDLFMDHLKQKDIFYEPCTICGKAAQHSLTLFNFEGGGTYRYPLCQSDYIRMFHELQKSVAWAYAQDQAKKCKEMEDE